ncbi:amino acid permease [Alteribacillus bidgolensis]|uniref:amino acid permease n=1 Tax=Alteribacillus bidgolensis TaxID=930129 RepID=UPI0014762BA7|nr:amino acid permease [Alteribacillus bidgolensis]
MICLLSVIAIIGVNSSANISSLFVSLHIIFIIGFTGFLAYALFTGEKAGSLVSPEPFLHVDLSLPIALAGASIVVFSFLGFDTMTTLSEKTKKATKTIPKAIFIMIGIVGVLHVTMSYFIELSFPAFTFQNPDSAH